MKLNKKAVSKWLAVAGVGVLIVLILVTGFRPGTATAKPDKRYLIGYRERVDESLIRAHGGQLIRTYKTIPVVAARLPEAAVSALSRNPQIAYVEPDGACYPTADTVPWGVSRVGSYKAQTQAGWTGAGVKVAIIDTGIDLTHPDLRVRGGVSFVEGFSQPWDDVGHGTHVAGIVAALANGSGVLGCAPAVELYAVKVLWAGSSSDPPGYMSDLIAGIDWAATNGMNIANISLRTEYDSTAVHQACDAAYAAGVLLVCAAGNEGKGTDTVVCPARYDSCIAVAAVDALNLRANFSSTGPSVELAAPGVDVQSTLPGGKYGFMSGSSMAAPHVSGLAAQIWAANGSLTNGQLRNILATTAASSHDLGAAGRDVEYGYGLICGVEAASLPKSLTCSVVTDRDTYQMYEPVTVTTSAIDQCGVGLRSATASVSVSSPRSLPYEDSGTTDQQGLWATVFIPDWPGSYTVDASVCKEGYGSDSANWSFEVTFEILP